MNKKLNKAVTLFQSGNYIGARTATESYLKKNSNDVDAYMLLAAIHAADKDYEGVLLACNSALVVSPDNARVLYNATVACQVLADYQQLVSYATRLLELDPANLAVSVMLVYGLFETGKTDDSIEHARKILSSTDAPHETILDIIRFYRKKKALDITSSFIEAALDVYPRNEDIILEKIYALIDVGDIASAESIISGSIFLQNSKSAVAKSLIANGSGRPQEAIKILEDVPGSDVSPDISSKLGSLYMQCSRYDEAKSLYENNLLKNINLAESYHNLGNISDLNDEYDVAIDLYNSALEHAPDSERTYYNLALVYEKDGNFKSAIDCIQRCQKRSLTQLFKQIYVRLLAKIGSQDIEVTYENEIISLLDDETVDCEPLSNLIIELIREDDVVNNLFHLSTKNEQAEFDNAIDEIGIEFISGKQLLLKYLSCLNVIDYEFECFITMLRNYMLMKYDITEGIDAKFYNLYASMGIQCFLAGYIFFQSNNEMAVIQKLLGLSDLNIDDDSLSSIIVVSMYVPIHAFVAEAKAGSLSHGNDELIGQLLKMQLFDRISENTIYDTIESPFDINDEVSVLVRNQYEESPYPVWYRLPKIESRYIDQIIKDVAPYRDSSEFEFKEPDILIAGCGTGSHAILSSMRTRNNSVTAIDLSKRSLAFAIRNSKELNIPHLKFLHMDILKLPVLGKTFDIVESIGVIHHMDDPKKGLDCLVSCLREGGLINLAVYSTIARRHIHQAKSAYDKDDRRISDDEIRDARRLIMATSDSDMSKNLSSFSDFYALHECRDLIFHESEKTYRMEELDRLIAGCGLTFLGFDLSEPSTKSVYRKMFPEDKQMTNFKNWDIFENKYPDTFSSMYTFWCYKK